MAEINFDEMSNSEIGVKLKELENEYEILQIKIKDDMEKLLLLNDSYLKGKSVLTKRTKGKV